VTRRLHGLIVVVAVLGAPAVAAAQAKPQPPAKAPASQGSGKEFIVGGAWLGPVGMGSASADLLASNGSTLTLFETENSLGSGYGLTAGFGFELTRSLWAEVLGGWSRATLRTGISDDFEDADIEPIRSHISRFTVEGAALWYFRAGGANAWFARGGGGWGRELDETRSLAEDTFHGTASIGWRHWWGPTAARARSGLRASGGVEMRTGGLTLGESTLRFGPTASVHIFFGF
jgi:opacity protein-like surface antigen